MKKSDGFTLIELLVVIAIIGILSAVVLAALNAPRNKGNDASTKATMKNIFSQSSLVYDNNTNTYGIGIAAAGTVAPCPATISNPGSLWATTTVATMVTSINSTSGGVALCVTNAAIAGSVAAWRMEAPLRINNSTWCIDSTGAAKVPTTAMTNGATGVAVTCP